MAKWKDTPSATKAKEALEEAAGKALAAATANGSKTKRKYRLKSIVKYYQGTAAAAKAAEQLAGL